MPRAANRPHRDHQTADGRRSDTWATKLPDHSKPGCTGRSNRSAGALPRCHLGCPLLPLSGRSADYVARSGSGRKADMPNQRVNVRHDPKRTKLTPYGSHRGKRPWDTCDREMVLSSTTYRTARASPSMEPMVEARVMHLVGPVASTSPRVTCRAQVSCKSLRPRTGLPVRGLLQNHMEEEYGYHDTSNHRHRAASCRCAWRLALRRPVHGRWRRPGPGHTPHLGSNGPTMRSASR